MSTVPTPPVISFDPKALVQKYGSGVALLVIGAAYFFLGDQLHGVAFVLAALTSFGYHVPSAPTLPTN